MRTSIWWRRAVARLTRNRLDDEMREEIRDHLERRRQQLIADGMDPADAAIEARRGFGNVTRVREELRDGWGFPRLESLMQDVRYGARILRRAPGFTMVAVLSLSLGIGAAAAVFNLADAVLFRPLSVRDPASLRHFRASIGIGAGPGQERGLRRGARGDRGDATRRGLRGPDRLPQRGRRRAGDLGRRRALVRVELVSPHYFSVLGVPAQAGRLLDAGDRGPSPVPVVVSERLWRGRDGGRPRRGRPERGPQRRPGDHRRDRSAISGD